MSNIRKTPVKVNSDGYLKAIFGPMFSGKTTYLIQEFEKSDKQYAKVFKPTIDNRYSNEHVVSHNKHQISAKVIEQSQKLTDHLSPQDEFLFFDEIQFFDESVVETCNELKKQGYKIMVAGLDKDSDQNEFAVSSHIRSIADEVINLKGECAVCGAPAPHTYYKAGEKNSQIAVGGPELYECRCSNCI